MSTVALASTLAAASDPPLFCGGNGGIAYRDTLTCECFDCFTGPNCTERVSGRCTVVATGGNPLLMQDFWFALAAGGEWAGFTPIESYFRTGYQHNAETGSVHYNKGTLWRALSDAVLSLHQRFGNANTANKTVVFGAGATTLIAASQVAYARVLESQRRKGPAAAAAAAKGLLVYAEPPYYGGYKGFASLGTLGASFTGDAAEADADRARVLQIATSPNNPTGHARNATLFSDGGGAPLGAVYDRVYFWPSLAEVDARDEPGEAEGVTLFSLSKLSGHASTRLGWALVDDPFVAAAMENYISTAQIEVSSASMYRALSIIRALDSPVGDRFMQFVRENLQARWGEVLSVLGAASNAFSIESRPGQFYLWVRCLSASTSSCYDVFAAGGILGEPGASFGAGPEYVRIELMQHTVVWSSFVDNLKGIAVAAGR
jgi:hypothetical protein